MTGVAALEERTVAFTCGAARLVVPPPGHDAPLRLVLATLEPALDVVLYAITMNDAVDPEGRLLTFTEVVDEATVPREDRLRTINQ